MIPVQQYSSTRHICLHRHKVQQLRCDTITHPTRRRRRGKTTKVEHNRPHMEPSQLKLQKSCAVRRAMKGGQTSPAAGCIHLSLRALCSVNSNQTVGRSAVVVLCSFSHYVRVLIQVHRMTHASNHDISYLKALVYEIVKGDVQDLPLVVVITPHMVLGDQQVPRVAKYHGRPGWLFGWLVH